MYVPMCAYLECTPRRKHIPASSGMQSTPSIRGQQVLMLLLSDNSVTLVHEYTMGFRHARWGRETFES